MLTWYNYATAMNAKRSAGIKATLVTHLVLRYEINLGWGKEWWRDGVRTGQNQALQDVGAVVPTSYEASNHAEAVLIMSEEICLNQFIEEKLSTEHAGLMRSLSMVNSYQERSPRSPVETARDPVLVKKIGAATALEARATGIPYVFAPCIAEDGGEIVQACNLASRFFTFGERERGG
ncbi:hypothetical protein POM88_051784 [Heracleum sosnowskyi]|uniref:Uncharacterized protein n=1 Tax=Heracleum sosnowskyi TaxID=360622 RepID=A0AAD8H2I9_9APIA|nr:hypothetical protein POM88_051784 [Heracleum sosnowskyi]